MVGCYLMNHPLLMIQDPEIAKEVMVKQFSSFHDRQSPAMMDRWEYCQVWPLTNFFLLAFWLQSLICQEGKSRCGENFILFCSSQQLPLFRLGPFKAYLSCHGVLHEMFTSPLELLPELQINKDTTRCAAQNGPVRQATVKNK